MVERRLKEAALSKEHQKAPLAHSSHNMTWCHGVGSIRLCAASGSRDGQANAELDQNKGSRFCTAMSCIIGVAAGYRKPVLQWSRVKLQYSIMCIDRPETTKSDRTCHEDQNKPNKSKSVEARLTAALIQNRFGISLKELTFSKLWLEHF